jgi:hypothetical protein
MRLGVDATFRKQAHLRGGYIFDGSEASGPSIGFGLQHGGFVIDIGRLFEGLASSAGDGPVYLSLRYLF